jgi:hypothetical protein
MGYFFSVWLVLIIGWLLHVFLDHHADRRTTRRVVELALLWVLVGGGVGAILGGLSHIGPNSGRVADQIGYAHSRFQWEVGWADIALGVLGIGCAWRRLRGTWLTAAVVALAISYGGDEIGHLVEWAHGNDHPDNVWSIPNDILQPLLAIVLLVAYRRLNRGAPKAARPR